MTSAEDIVEWWKGYFQVLLNPNDMPSVEEEFGDKGDNLLGVRSLR